MDILVISALIFFGLLFCVVELLVLPGITLGGILSVACNGGAIYMAFGELGFVGGIIVVVIIAILTCVAIAVSLRAKTWARFSLTSKIESSSSDAPQAQVAVGQRGVAISRLAPMGRVEIDGSSYEAKSSDAYIDAKRAVEVVGFDNFSVVVKRVE